MGEPLKKIIAGIACGLVVVCATIFFTVSDNSLRQRLTEESTGVITQITRGHDRFVAVAHYVNGVRYVDRLMNNWYGGMREGMQIRIYYDPANPRQIRSDNSTITLLIFFVVALAGFIFSFFMIKEGWAELADTSSGNVVHDHAAFWERIKDMPQKEAEAEIVAAFELGPDPEEAYNWMSIKETIIRCLPGIVLTIAFVVLLQLWL